METQHDNIYDSAKPVIRGTFVAIKSTLGNKKNVE